jgi:hypothetical protein
MAMNWPVMVMDTNEPVTRHQKHFFQIFNVAKLILEDLAGYEVKGYRAPSFSIGEKNLWAFECLERAGYHYSSSIYPIRHDHYGMPDAPRHAHKIGNLLEIPATTLRFFNRNWPASGGGYFRLMPYGLSRWMIRADQSRRSSCQPCSIFTLGKSIVSNLAFPISGQKPASGITSISATWNIGCVASWQILTGDEWTIFFLSKA